MMDEPLKSLEPSVGQPVRKRLRLRDEFVLALLPTATVLLVFLMVESFVRQRFLFASLAASAFLVFTNRL